MLKKLQHFLVLLLGLAMGLTACTGESNVGQEDLQPVVVSGPISRVESFSPDGSMFVSVEERVMAGPVKRIMDLEGNTYELPCSPISYDEANFGPVFWQGTRLVYSVTGWGPGAAIYVYDWIEQTSVNIAEGFNWDSSEPPSVRPVFSGENAVTMLQPDGIWSYDLQQQRWEHRRLQLPARRGLETWSPDLGKVAWVEYGQEEARLVVLEVQSGQLQTVFEGQGIAGFAWAEDGVRLAVLEQHEPDGAGTKLPLTVLSVDGQVLKSFADPGVRFPGNAYATEMTWVPGQEKVAYNSEDGVVIKDLDDGGRWLIPPPAIPPEMAATVQKEFSSDAELTIGHTWLNNGNLAISHSYLCLASPGLGVMEIYSLDWEKWDK